MGGWAREYWNSASWRTGSGERHIESLGNLRQLKEEKNRLKQAQLAREGKGQGDDPGVGESRQEWKKVEPFSLDEEDEEETERFVKAKGDSVNGDDGEYAPAVEYEEGERRIAHPGSPLFGSDERKDAALADSPRVAIEDEALNRAPMAALGGSTDTDDSSDSGALTSEGTGLADHAAAKIPSSDNDKVEGKPLNDKLRKPKPKPKPVGAAGKPKKIGTGGKVVKPEEILAPVGGGGEGGHAAKGVGEAVGGGEKAGKVVQAEAGKRVGTGARPGAKGMGLERVEVMGAERRRRPRRRTIKI